MAKFYDCLTDKLSEFIGEQKLFFVASAPEQGRVSLSPKGMDTLRVLDPTRVAYLDLTGSGAETSAHILQNGRLTMMFCSFEETPLILRLYGRGELIRPDHAQWDALHQGFAHRLGERQIIVLHIDSVQTSCGFSIPYFDYKGERPTLEAWSEKKGKAGIEQYWREKNQLSIDGLPTGISQARDPD